MIPSKLRMLHQYCKSDFDKMKFPLNDRNDRSLVSIRDFLEYQQQWLNYLTYLGSLRSQNDLSSCYTDHRMMQVGKRMIEKFGCGLDATTLEKVYSCLSETSYIVWHDTKFFAYTHNLLDMANTRSQFQLGESTRKTSIYSKLATRLCDQLVQLTNNDIFKKIKVKIKGQKKAKVKTKKSSVKNITPAMIKSGKHLQLDVKLLLLAACNFDMEQFAKITRNFHNRRTVIDMIRNSKLMEMDTNEIYFNLSEGKYLFELLKYYCDGNINLCNDSEIKMILHWYYAQYYQIISYSYEFNELGHECDEKHRKSYDKRVGLIINHFHSAFVERLKNKKKYHIYGSKIAIDYISFLLSIWDKPNCQESKKEKIKQFWNDVFSNCNDTFTEWFFDDTIEQESKELEILTHLWDKGRLTDEKTIHAMYLYTFLLFKMGKYNDGYHMLSRLCRQRVKCTEFRRCACGKSIIHTLENILTEMIVVVR